MRPVLVALLVLATPSLADGPGTRILTTPSGPQRPSAAAERDLQRCETLREQAKERCMKDVRAGSGASSGTSGTPGGAAPR